MPILCIDVYIAQDWLLAWGGFVFGGLSSRSADQWKGFPMADVGFIGTGNIGNPMCANVIRGGHRVVVHDIVEEQTANLIELGAVWGESAAAVASQSEVVLTSLPGPVEVEAVLRGSDGVLAGAEAGLVCFDLSTNLPSTVRALGERASERGVTLLDSPVSNGVAGAIKGELAVMVGGDRGAFDRYRGVLECIGSHVFYMGELGSGAMTKILNNMVGLSSIQLLVEAVVLAEKAGLDPWRVHEVMSVASARQYVGNMPVILKREFEDPTFFCSGRRRMCRWRWRRRVSWGWRCRLRRRRGISCIGRGIVGWGVSR